MSQKATSLSPSCYYYECVGDILQNLKGVDEGASQHKICGRIMIGHISIEITVHLPFKNTSFLINRI